MFDDCGRCEDDAAPVRLKASLDNASPVPAQAGPSPFKGPAPPSPTVSTLSSLDSLDALLSRLTSPSDDDLF